MDDTLDPEGWTHRLPAWQREEAPGAGGWRGRFRMFPGNGRIAFYAAMLALLWFSYFALRTGIAAVHGTALDFALPRLFLAACGFALTFLLGVAIHRIERVGPGAAIAATILAVFAGTWLFTVLNLETQIFLYPEKSGEIRKYMDKEFWWAYYPNVYLFIAWGCLHFLVRYFVSLQQQRQATLRAVALAQEAKLEVLRYQLNPHFLFNTLNAISTLVLQERTKMAEETIDRLSTFLRHTLASDPKQQVTLAEELQAIDLYLQIQQVRFGKRMAYDFRISEDTRNGCVPSLILQPVVENAVKYAVAPQQEGGRVEISARREGPDLVIEVCDTGPGVPDPARVSIKGTGVGLANCRARLREFYGPVAGLALRNRETRGLCVRIVIPYQEAPRDE